VELEKYACPLFSQLVEKFPAIEPNRPLMTYYRYMKRANPKVKAVYQLIWLGV